MVGKLIPAPAEDLESDIVYVLWCLKINLETMLDLLLPTRVLR